MSKSAHDEIADELETALRENRAAVIEDQSYGLRVRYERDRQVDAWVAKAPDLPGFVLAGERFAILRLDVDRTMIAFARRQGIPLVAR